MMNGYKRYDIVLVNFGDDVVGSEQGGIRPAIIIQNDIGNKYSSTTIVMPLTTKIKNLNQSTHTLIKRNRDNGLSSNSMLLGECMRQVSEQRIIKYVGTVSDDKTQLQIKSVYIANFG